MWCDDTRSVYFSASHFRNIWEIPLTLPQRESTHNMVRSRIADRYYIRLFYSLAHILFCGCFIYRPTDRIIKQRLYKLHKTTYKTKFIPHNNPEIIIFLPMKWFQGCSLQYCVCVDWKTNGLIHLLICITSTFLIRFQNICNTVIMGICYCRSENWIKTQILY